MKKILFAIVITVMMSFGAKAQRVDGFVNEWDNSRTIATPEIPWGAVGFILQDVNAYNEPLGDGLLILTALGGGYALARKKSKKKFKN